MDPKKSLSTEITAPDAAVEKPGRRAALRKLGLFGLAAYAAPALMNLSDAEAASRSRSGGRRRKKKARRRNRNRSRSVSRSRSRG